VELQRRGDHGCGQVQARVWGNVQLRTGQVVGQYAWGLRQTHINIMSTLRTPSTQWVVAWENGMLRAAANNTEQRQLTLRFTAFATDKISTDSNLLRVR